MGWSMRNGYQGVEIGGDARAVDLDPGAINGGGWLDLAPIGHLLGPIADTESNGRCEHIKNISNHSPHGKGLN